MQYARFQLKINPFTLIGATIRSGFTLYYTVYWVWHQLATDITMHDY